MSQNQSIDEEEQKNSQLMLKYIKLVVSGNLPAMLRRDREQLLNYIGSAHKNLSKKEDEKADAYEHKPLEKLRELICKLPEIPESPWSVTLNGMQKMEEVVAHLCRITQCELYNNYLEDAKDYKPEYKKMCYEGKTIIDVCKMLRALIVDGVYDIDNHIRFKEESFEESSEYHCLLEYIEKHKDELMKKANARLDLIARLKRSMEELGEDEVKDLFNTHGKRPVPKGEAGPAEPPQQRQRLAALFDSD